MYYGGGVSTPYPVIYVIVVMIVIVVVAMAIAIRSPSPCIARGVGIRMRRHDGVVVIGIVVIGGSPLHTPRTLPRESVGTAYMCVCMCIASTDAIRVVAPASAYPCASREGVSMRGYMLEYMI